MMMSKIKKNVGKFHIEFLTTAQKLAWAGFQQHDVLFLIGPAGVGKAQPLDAVVYTPGGPKKMEDIIVGDIISTPDGNTAKVISVFPQGLMDVYRIIFSNGDMVEASKEHLWKINSTQRQWAGKVVDTAYIEKNVKTPSGKRNFYINCTKPVQFIKKEVPIDPYIFGVLLGDGGLTGGSVILTNVDNELIDIVCSKLEDGYFLKPKASCGYEYLLTTHNRHNPNIYKQRLKSLNIWGCRSWEKHIPDVYLYNSVNVRFALLQGLMDTDGTVTKNGHISFCTTSNKLAEQFKILVQSLGGNCVIIPKTKKFKYLGKIKTGRLAYHCSVSFNESHIVFKLNRKKQRCLPRKKYTVRRFIEKVEHIGQKECKCILLDNDEHLYLTNNFVITHNTHVAMAFAIHEILQGNRKRIILTRPIVEAGESLGYLPGDFHEKVAPYMCPLMDCMKKLVPSPLQHDAVAASIEIAPVAYLRGRTFENSVAIFDEAQNATRMQLKLFLSRLGENSKIIVNGDPSQSDIEPDSGLMDVIHRLETVPGISVVQFKEDSIVRHPLVSAMLAKLEN